MKKIIKYLNEIMKKEKSLLVFNVLLFIIGVVLGSLFINLITKEDKNLLINQVEIFFSNVKSLNNNVFGLKFFTSEIINNFLQLFIIFSLGVSLIGIIAVIVILFFKGFMLGTTLSAIILKYKIKGILACFLYVFPVMILNIIIYILFSFLSIGTSLKFIKALFKKSELNLKSFFGRYVLFFILSIILISIISLLDAYLTPLLLKLFTYLI